MRVKCPVLYYTGEEQKDFCVYGELSIKRPQASYVFDLVLALTFSLQMENRIPPVLAEFAGLGCACSTGLHGCGG